MKDIEVKLKTKAWHIGDFDDDFDDWTELCKWCADTDGMSCSMIVRARVLDDDMSVVFQVEGIDFATINPRPNSWVLFNGYAFSVMTEDEFKESQK